MYGIQPKPFSITNNLLSSRNLGGHVEGTQLLTPKGWKNISQITKEDNVIQWNPDGSMQFVNPLTVSSSEVPYTINMQNQQGHINQEVSPNHQIIYDRKGIAQEISVQQLGTIRNRNTSNCINTGKISIEGNGLSVRERLLIAIQADGYFNNPEKRTGERIGMVPVNFSFAKARKSDRLMELASESGLRLVDRKVDKRGRQNWALYIPSQDQILWPRDKKLSSITDLDSVSFLWCAEFIDEAALWDGHIVKENNDRITWRCVDRDNTEYMQAVASLAGYRTHFSQRADLRRESFSDIYSVQISKHINKTSVQSVTLSRNDTPKQVYAIKVPSNYLLVRKDGGVSISGS